MAAGNLGTNLGGRYHIVREIGVGGMGRVYQAVDTTTGRAVAAKVMILREDNNLDTLLRFHQEGALLSTLKHPNIVEVYSSYLEGSTSFIIMELLEGRSLQQILAVERLPLPRVKRMMVQVCSALAYANAHEIIHRDIKPSNIMVTGDDHVTVTDFGIARVSRSGATLRTMTGTSVGTPFYMSPEQVEGGPVDGRTDVYSVGVVLYEMVTGRRPFEGEDPITVAFKHVHRAPTPPTEIDASVPADWEAVILRALAKDPADRYSSASAMEEALAALSDGTTVKAAAPPRTRPAEEAPPAGRVNVPPLEPRSTPPERPAEPVPNREAAPSPAPPRAPAGKGKGVVPAAIAGGALLLVLLIAAALYATLGSKRTSATPTATAAPTTAPLPSNIVVHMWGSAGSRPGQFRDPVAATLDSHGNIYVVDADNNRIQKFSPDGTFLQALGTAGSRPGHLYHPHGVALDGHGNLYVADTGNNRVEKFAPTGAFLAGWGSRGSGEGQFNAPMAVTIVHGNIYVADTGNNRIQVLSRTGTYLSCWGSQSMCVGAQFNRPDGVAVDSQSDIYVADTGNDRIQALTTAGDLLNTWGSRGSAPGRLNGPEGVTLDAAGNVYVADTGNNRIEKFDATGKYLTAWGKQGSGPGAFDAPTSVRVDQQGNVFVVDSANDRIQKLSFRT